jgi:hypothetical protein
LKEDPVSFRAEIHLLSCQLKVRRVSLNGRQPSLPGAEVLASSRDNLLFNEIKTGGTAISIALTKGRFFVFLEEFFVTIFQNLVKSYFDNLLTHNKITIFDKIRVVHGTCTSREEN